MASRRHRRRILSTVALNLLSLALLIQTQPFSQGLRDGSRLGYEIFPIPRQAERPAAAKTEPSTRRVSDGLRARAFFQAASGDLDQVQRLVAETSSTEPRLGEFPFETAQMKGTDFGIDLNGILLRHVVSVPLFRVETIQLEYKKGFWRTNSDGSEIFFARGIRCSVRVTSIPFLGACWISDQQDKNAFKSRVHFQYFGGDPGERLEQVKVSLLGGVDAVFSRLAAIERDRYLKLIGGGSNSYEPMTAALPTYTGNEQSNAPTMINSPTILSLGEIRALVSVNQKRFLLANTRSSHD